MTETTTAVKEQAVPAVFAALLQVQEKVGAIAKDRQNPHYKYLYRGIDQLYSVMHPLLVEAGIVVLQAVIQSIDTPLDKGFRVKQRIRFTFFASDGSSVAAEVEGEGADPNDRASAKATTDAYKTLCFKTFCIPVEEVSDDDPDGAAPEVRAPKAEAKPSPEPKAQAANGETRTANPGGTIRTTFIPKVEPFTFTAGSDRKDGTKKGDTLTAYRVTSPKGNKLTLWDKDNGKWAMAAEKEGRALGFILKPGKEYKGKPQFEVLDVYDPATGEAA